MTYSELLQITQSRETLLREETRHPDPDEIEVQSRWFAGYFPSEHLGNHGQKVKIISLGEWNRGAGPDFLRAAVEIDGEAHQGPIELDLDSRSWDLHGHSESTHFNDVILHIVLHDQGPTYFTRSSAHREIPRICLSPESVQEALGHPRISQALARPGACLTPLARMPDESIDSLLKEAALHRAEEKALHFEHHSEWQTPSQALWESFADCLGYSENRLSMRLLAQRLPIQSLKKHPAEEIEAILFGSAGFLSPALHEDAPDDSKDYLQSLWHHWWKHRDQYEFDRDRQLAWSTRATRPGNHPQRRLAALATIASDWSNIELLAKMKPPFSELASALESLPHIFWTHHHTLRSARKEKPLRIFGSSRVHEFFINTLFPLELPRSWDHFSKLRAGEPNQKVKRCCERLFGSLAKAKPHLDRAWKHQALLQVYRDFCLEDSSDCASCPFPMQLSQWNQ
jgi:hypothetical protein